MKGERWEPKRWQATRARILGRDGYVCQVQLPGCEGEATTVDHILSRVQGGGHEDGNLRAACRHCNSARGGRTRRIPRRVIANVSPWG